MSDTPDDDDKVARLPAPKPAADSPAFLVPVPYKSCEHYRGPFEVDISGNRCRCKECGGEVSPIFVLSRLMDQESRWQRTRAAYQDEMKRLEERSSTKCQHCGKMTRISSR